MQESPQKSSMTRRDFLKVVTITTGGLAVTGCGGIFYSMKIEPHNLDVTQVSIPIKGLAEQFEGYRIVQFSDIHCDSWMGRERLQTVVDLVNAQSPHLIAITGDYVTKGNQVDRWADDLIPPLQSLRASDGVVAVLGNHDHWTNASAVRDILKSSRLHELNNDSFLIERDGKRLAIGGVDDVWERKADLDKVIASLPDNAPAILLAHEPDFADRVAATGRFALMLSGHSHGGQVRLPFIGAPVLPYLGEKYSMGRYQVGNMIQYTNRGVGMIPPTLRFGCPPEITVFTLQADS